MSEKDQHKKEDVDVIVISDEEADNKSNDRLNQDERQDCDSVDDSIQYKRYDGEWYNNENKTPVFKWSGKRFQEGNKLCKYLLEPAEPDTICTAVPRNVAHNTTFLLDVEKLSHHDDWKSDDMGVWKHNGKHGSTLALLKGGFIDVGVSSPSKTIATYKLSKRYYKNKSNQAVRKCVSWLEGNPDLICIQYVFQDGEIALKSLPHGNAKHDNRAYVRTKESTRVQLLEKSASHAPKMAYQTVNEQMGGTVRATSISDLPRGKEQARYLKRKHSDSTNKIDSLVMMLGEKCKRQHLSRHEELYIQEVICAPELRFVLCFKWQIEEMILFCTNPRKFSILGADTAFNLGRFNLTVTTYQNLKVVDKKTGKHPIMIGPVFMSLTKSYDAFHYFFSKMVGLSQDCANIMVFATDGEEQLSKAMQRAFPRAIHLRCFDHFRENCIAKLRKSNVPDTEIKLFLNDIFGRRIEDVFEGGIVDSISEEDFKVKVMSLEESWNERERKYLPPKQQPSFYEYFIERIEMMSANMLKEVRVNAGLVDPPSQYSTNIPESAKTLIQRAVSFKESEMADFCSKMEEIVRHQRSDTENAITNKGPYELAATHQNFQIETDEWFRMNTRQRKSHLNKFHASVLIPREKAKKPSHR